MTYGLKRSILLLPLVAPMCVGLSLRIADMTRWWRVNQQLQRQVIR